MDAHHQKPQNSSRTSMRLGDWAVILFCVLISVYLFKSLWRTEQATKVQIKYGAQVVGTYSLNQSRDIHLHGAIGETRIMISQGKVRFFSAPCTNQYCVHQGWLHHAGQSAICLPNQISIALLGKQKPFDTLNY